MTALRRTYYPHSGRILAAFMQIRFGITYYASASVRGAHKVRIRASGAVVCFATILFDGIDANQHTKRCGDYAQVDGAFLAASSNSSASFQMLFFAALAFGFNTDSVIGSIINGKDFTTRYAPSVNTWLDYRHFATDSLRSDAYARMPGKRWFEVERCGIIDVACVVYYVWLVLFILYNTQ